MKHQNHTTTRRIHWLMAGLILFLLSLGFYMKNTESYQFYALHKSFGVLAFIAIWVRLYWRSKQPWQSFSKDQPYEKWVTAVHWCLLALLLLMPLSGLMLSGFGGYGVSLFGIPLIAENRNIAGEAQAYSQVLSDIGYASHEVIGYLFAGLIGLHILAALKHHFIDKDATLLRMLGKDTN